MPLGTEVGLGPGHIVLDGDLATLPQRGMPPIFGPCLLWPNRWIKMSLGTEVDLGPGDTVCLGLIFHFFTINFHFST